MENREFIRHAAEVFRRNETEARINGGQKMTVGEIKTLLMTATVDGRKLEFYELDDPIARLAQAKGDNSSALTFVRAVLNLDRMRSSKDS